MDSAALTLSAATVSNGPVESSRTVSSSGCAKRAPLPTRTTSTVTSAVRSILRQEKMLIQMGRTGSSANSARSGFTLTARSRMAT
jgi:hypothetical protein